VSLLGITWIVGPFSIGYARLPFHYIFSLTTPLQGLIIFIVRVLQHNESKNSWINFFKTGSLRQRPKTPQSSFHTNSSIHMNTTSNNSQTVLTNGVSPKSSFTNSSVSSGRKNLVKLNSGGTPRLHYKNSDHQNIRRRGSKTGSVASSKKQNGLLGQIFSKKISGMKAQDQPEIPTILGLMSKEQRPSRGNEEMVLDMKQYWEKSPKDVTPKRRDMSDGCTFTEFIERQQYFDNLLYVGQSQRGIRPTNGYPVIAIGKNQDAHSIPPTLHLSEYTRKSQKPVLFTQDKSSGYYHPEQSQIPQGSKLYSLSIPQLVPYNRHLAKNHPRFRHMSHDYNIDNRRRHDKRYSTFHDTSAGLPRTLSEYKIFNDNVNTFTEYRKEDASLRRCISSDCLASGGVIWCDDSCT